MLAAHADWSVDGRKRWICIARSGTRWRLDAPEPVGPPHTLLSRLTGAAGQTALGVDFPIGLPRAYAATIGKKLPSFPVWLSDLDPVGSFFQVADTVAEISAGRPFYPRRGLRGMTRASHAQALGLPDARALCRACDLATTERPAGAPLFWTLGANQSGKAALAAWRDMLIPALHGAAPPAIWPFDGPFRTLLAPGRVAVAETYPAEAMRQLGVKLKGSKRRRADRIACAPAIAAAMARLGAAGSPAFDAALAAGFGDDAAGEDRFDCVLGLLCVIGVLEGARPDAAPDDPWIRHWEGWVLGQAPGLNAGAGATPACCTAMEF